MTVDEMFEFLKAVIGVDEDAIRMVAGINGYNEETANDICHYKTGYRSIADYCEGEKIHFFRPEIIPGFETSIELFKKL